VTRIYLDHNATSPTRPEVIDAVSAALTVSGNPSAQHKDGRSANALISEAREAVGQAMCVRSQDIIFTSGGTEGDNTAIYSAIKSGTRRVLISSMDHPATILAAEAFGAEVEPIPADQNGLTDLDWLETRLQGWDVSDGRPFVSIVAANSETGVLQDYAKAVQITHAAGGLILIDAVQALGKLSLEFNADSRPDYISVTAHKIGGPKGVGALYVDPNAPFSALLSGGGQERRRRAGTLNVAGIAGFGAAVKAMRDHSHTEALRGKLEAGLKDIEPDLTIFGAGAERLPNTSFFAVPDAASQTLMMALDLEGISVSTGTACSSGKVGASRAITAMGLSELAPKGAIRVSFGYNSTDSDVENFLTAWTKIRQKQDKMRGAA